jgi:hypothetical protein
MKKQLLFENVNGNTFKLLKENAEAKPIHETLVSSGLKKVFQNSKGKVTYRQIESVGFGYIKDITEAKNVALKEARILAKEYGYEEDEDDSKFIKKEIAPDNAGMNVERPASEEKREVQIGKEILKHTNYLSNKIKEVDSPQMDFALGKITALASELIKLHEKQ